MAKFQHVVRKVLEVHGQEGSVGGQMLVIIIRLLYDFQYIYAKCLCCLVAFTVLESSLSLYVNLIIYGLFCSGSCSLYRRYGNLLKMFSFMKLNIVSED